MIKQLKQVMRLDSPDEVCSSGNPPGGWPLRGLLLSRVSRVLQRQFQPDERKLEVRDRAWGLDVVSEVEVDRRAAFCQRRWPACSPPLLRQHPFQVCNRDAETDERLICGRCRACVRRRLGCILFGLLSYSKVAFVICTPAVGGATSMNSDRSHSNVATGQAPSLDMGCAD